MSGKLFEEMAHSLITAMYLLNPPQVSCEVSNSYVVHSRYGVYPLMNLPVLQLIFL